MTISDNTLNTFNRHFEGKLNKVYDKRELSNIWFLIMESKLHLTRNFTLSNPEHKLSESEILQLLAITKRLVKNEPIQYILEEAHFFGMKLKVNHHVLIPRPETEELVDWILKTLGPKSNASILDIGTGSGCIPLALKKNNKNLRLTAIDVSEDALSLAEENTISQSQEVEFMLADITDKDSWENMQSFKVIVSNPPYVLRKEASSLEKRVIDHEPDVALFVEDNDPLFFYRVIAEFALEKLQNEGLLFFEINEAKGDEVIKLLESLSFKEITLKQDLNGKPRMIKAIL